MDQHSALTALWLVRRLWAIRHTRLGHLPGCEKHKRSVMPAVGLLLCIGVIIVVQLLYPQLAHGAGIGIDGQMVSIDLGTTVPDQPTIWSNALHLTLWSSVPWYLSIQGEGLLQAADNKTLPLERLAWALITPDAVARWSPLSTTPQVVVEDALPTESSGKSLTLGFRVDPSWDDPPGGPYSTKLHLALAGGTDLIPSYVWPQPAVVGDQVSITYYTGDSITQSSFPVTLAIQDVHGVQVHNEVVLAAAEQWSTFYWDTVGNMPGTYRYQVIGPDAALLAQGVIELLDQAPTVGNCRVTGSVNAKGMWLSGVRVHLYDSAYRQVAVVSTDAAGDFAFVELPSGGYHLEVRHPGYLPWHSTRFYIDEATDTHHAKIELIPNNALSIEADYRVVRVINGAQVAGSIVQQIQPGDIVEVTGVVRNTGTRYLHAPEVEISWPDNIAGLCNAVADGSTCTYTLPNLAPGQSASFNTIGVVEWEESSDPYFLHDTSSHRVKIDAHAWAQNADDTLTLVSAATRFLTFASRRPNQMAGYLAMQLYWDRNGNGQIDPDEEGASGVELKLSTGERIKTQLDGWAYAGLSDEFISVWLTRSKAADTMSHFITASELSQLLRDDVLLYQGIVRPGVVEVVRIGLNNDGTPTQPLRNQLVLLWTPGTRTFWQAQGHLRTGGQNWQLSLDLPLRFNAAYFSHSPSGWKQLHQLSAGQYAAKPYLVWHSQIQTSSEDAPQSVIDAQLALGTQEPTLWERLLLLGSGPYQLPTRVKAVHRVVGCYLGEQVNLTAQQYVWSPAGTIWLTQQPQAWLPGQYGSNPQQSMLNNVCSRETEYVLYVLFTPESTAATANPVLAVSVYMQTHPDAVTAGSENDQWHLRWLYPWAQDDSTRWRWGFTRQIGTGRFTWELGTFADPGFSLAENVVLTPSIPGSNDGAGLDSTLGPLHGLPIYLKVEQTWQRKDWQLQVNYQNLRSWQMRRISGTWRFQIPIAGDIGLVLRRYTGDVPALVGVPGTSLDFTLRLQHSFGPWSWQLNQRFPLWLSAQSSAGDTDKDVNRQLQPAGMFRVSWQARERSGVNVAFQLNTQSIQGALDLAWHNRMDSSWQLAMGMRCQIPFKQIFAQMMNSAAGEAEGTLLLSWAPWMQVGWRSAQNPYGLEMQLSYQGGKLPLIRFSWRIGSIWTQWEQSVQAQRLHMWYVGNHRSNLLALQLQYNTDNKQPDSMLSGRITWQGALPYFGDVTTGSISLQWGTYHNEQSQVMALSGVLATSVRRQFGANALAIGTSWPWLSARSADDARSVEQQSQCTWLLWERRLLHTSAFSLWGGLELRYTQGTWMPRWQITMK